MRRWSARQRDVLTLGADDKHPFHLVVGSPGAGKTATAIAAFMTWSLQYEGQQFALAAKTYRQARNVIAREIIKFCEEMGLPYARTADGLVVGKNEYIFFGGHDVRAQETIQGFQASGFYIDEVVNIPELVMMEINDRVREVPHGKIVMTANPRAPAHWFYKQYVKRADTIKMKQYKLYQSDNPALSEDYIERTQATSYGGFYKRRVLAEWAPLHGLIYTAYDQPTKCPEKAKASRWYISVDPGDSGVTHTLLIGKFAGTYWIAGEWVWDAEARQHQLSHSEQAKHISAWLKNEGVSPSLAVCDSANQSMVLELHRELEIPVVNSRKDVEEGIAITQHFLDDGKIRLSDNVPHLMDEIITYAWDEKAADQGDDKPLKTRDHGCDAMRYFVYTVGVERQRANIDVAWD